MRDDLVKRLRAVGRDYDFHENALIYEAADRIEELERHVRLRDIFLVENGFWERFANGAQDKTDD